ncbi:hypothetical protein SCALM49S_06349 [Streptomyces californicus]
MEGVPAAQARIAELGVKDEEGLQSWFIRHFDAWLTARGRRLIGWDEILEGGLAEGAAVSSWRGYAGGIAAAEAGHDVVMCPEQQVYLDHRQDGGPDEPMPIGYVRTLEDVYRFEPVPPGLSEEAARHVLGALQANVWTEVMQNRDRVDYQVFPRLAAFAEVVWSAPPGPGRPGLRGVRRPDERPTTPGLDALGVDYRRPEGPLPRQQRPGVLAARSRGPRRSSDPAPARRPQPSPGTAAADARPGASRVLGAWVRGVPGCPGACVPGCRARGRRGRTVPGARNA